MRRSLLAILCLLALLAGLFGLPALAEDGEAVLLENVFPDTDQVVVAEQNLLTVRYTAGQPGTLRVTARHDGGQGEFTLLEEAVDIGPGQLTWDGTNGGQAVADGEWTLTLTLTAAAAGPVSVPESVGVRVWAERPQPTPTPRVFRTPSPERQLSAFKDPHSSCFWQMDIDNLDVHNPDDQKLIWAIMQQPMTVLDIHPTEHVYPLISPAADAKDPKNYTGQIHGQSQGVHVLETLDNGFSHIEFYSNDGYNAPLQALRKLTAQLRSGYVKTSQLKTITPDPDIGVLIDKLTQRLYVFQKGKLTGELLISTGKPTKNQPYTETPAGEYICLSWVGQFINGNMFCDLAIRINGGVLLHEVPHKETAEGGRDYSAFRQYLGQKASHGCVRVESVANSDGMNMRWLWNNLKKNAKVLVWDDLGRSLPPPDPNTPVYYNPDGGKNYHKVARCPGVKDRFLPLTEFFYGELNLPPFDALTPCGVCNPPSRYEGDEAYFDYVEVPDDVVGEEDGATDIEQEVDPDSYEGGE